MRAWHKHKHLDQLHLFLIKTKSFPIFYEFSWTLLYACMGNLTHFPLWHPFAREHAFPNCETLARFLLARFHKLAPCLTHFNNLQCRITIAWLKSCKLCYSHLQNDTYSGCNRLKSFISIHKFQRDPWSLSNSCQPRVSFFSRALSQVLLSVVLVL